MAQDQERQEHAAVDDTPPEMPRWVKVFGILALALVLLFLILHLTGNAPMHHAA